MAVLRGPPASSTGSATALVFQASGPPVALISIDHLGMLTVQTSPLRAAIAAELSTTPERIMLLFTHTHAGADTEGDNLLLSGDYPGWTRRLLQERLDCPVLIRIGAAGNVNALYRGSAADLERMAQAISGPVLSHLPELTPSPDTALWCGSAHLQAPLLPLPTPDAATALAATVHERWGVNTQPWLQAVLALHARGERHPTLPLEVQLCRSGGGSLSGIPLEPFAETALDIARRLGAPLHFFGGYEADWNPVYAGWLGGLYMPAQPQVPDLIADAVTALYRQSLRN